MPKKANIQKINRAIALKKSKKPTRLNLLALDQATKCGVAYQLVGCDAVTQLWDLTKKTSESNGVKWLRFESMLVGFIKKHKISVVGYELPGGQHTGAKLHSAKLIAIIEKVAAELSIDYMEFSSKTIKKFATDNGNAKKEHMIKAAQDTLGYVGNDDNEADALWMLHLMKSEMS